MTENSSQSESREQRLDRIIAGYLDDQRLGRAPSQSDLLRRHADLAADLQSFFADQDQFRRLAEPIRPTPSVGLAQVPGPAPTVGPGETAVVMPAGGFRALRGGEESGEGGSGTRRTWPGSRQGEKSRRE
jgi:hypothetical protein